jgi:hypothetical protein
MQVLMDFGLLAVCGMVIGFMMLLVVGTVVVWPAWMVWKAWRGEL